MGYIYKIVNDINDKVYVCQTINSIEYRFKQHLYDAKRSECYEKRPLYRAMNKYGIDHFKIELIGEYPNEYLNDQEIYWIAYYKGYTDGYNANMGGESGCIYDHNLIAELLSNNPYPIEVAQEVGCSPDVVWEVAKTYNIQVRHRKEDEFSKLSKQIYRLDKQTNEILDIYPNTVSAAEWCKDNGYAAKGKSKGVSTHISDAAKGTRKTAYGFKWKFVNE